MTPADLVEEMKKGSSKWIKLKGPEYHDFFWQEGYGGFSVSGSLVEIVKNYIVNQEEHQKKISFLDEYKRLLDEYGVVYEDRYL